MADRGAGYTPLLASELLEPQLEGRQHRASRLRLPRCRCVSVARTIRPHQRNRIIIVSRISCGAAWWVAAVLAASWLAACSEKPPITPTPQGPTVSCPASIDVQSDDDNSVNVSYAPATPSG